MRPLFDFITKTKTGARMKQIAAGSGSRIEKAATFFGVTRSSFSCTALALAGLCSLPQISRADEGGVSFWLPGLYGSLAAAPQAAPGWSLYTFNYYTNVTAGADVAASREIEIGRFNPTVTVNLSASLKAQVDLEWIQPN